MLAKERKRRKEIRRKRLTVIHEIHLIEQYLKANRGRITRQERYQLKKKLVHYGEVLTSLSIKGGAHDDTE